MPTRSAGRKVPFSSKAKTIVFGCVDTFKERHEMEACCQHCLIPCIDISWACIRLGRSR